MGPIRSLAEAASRDVGPAGRLSSATHDEIASGLTTDIYFVRTVEILDRLELADTVVTAEIFAVRDGVLAGTDDALALLPASGLSVWALAPGTPFAAREVVMRISGPYGSFGMFETPLLGCLASASGWAAAARHCKDAAGDRTVVCFGARHVHPAVAPVMERAALVGGVDGVSCILAARLAGVPAVGTMPHALILLLGDTVAAAGHYHRLMPASAARVVLVDTFRDEVEESLRTARELGPALAGVRLDTPAERGGVTPFLVREVRARLDAEGFERVKVLVSGGLTPARIVELAAAGADAFGVGSYISGARAVDMTMDIKEINGRPVAKRGRIPGRTDSPRLVKVR